MQSRKREDGKAKKESQNTIEKQRQVKENKAKTNSIERVRHESRERKRGKADNAYNSRGANTRY